VDFEQCEAASCCSLSDTSLADSSAASAPSEQLTVDADRVVLLLHLGNMMNFTGHINPDVSIESFTMNITTLKGFDEFKASVTDPATGTSRVDLILSCVDNYEARITINQVWHTQCVKFNVKLTVKFW
jgi:hypothetical protein